MFANWVTDEQASRFWGWAPHKNIEETCALLNVWIKQYDTPTVYHWVLIHKQDNQAMGYIYLNDIDQVNECATIHYLVGRKYWNQGIATEACKAILKYAFSCIGLKTIRSHHHKDNPSSGKVMQKAGMHFTQTTYRQFPEGEESLNGYYCYYVINAGDWNRTN